MHGDGDVAAEGDFVAGGHTEGGTHLEGSAPDGDEDIPLVGVVR